MKLPKKLMKEPLVDALFEVRFLSSVPAASGILPGLLLPVLTSAEDASIQVERLQVADIPSQMRMTDPFLKYQPVLKLSNKSFLIFVGDLGVTIGCKLPYPGWTVFKKNIVAVVDSLRTSQFIREFERYSMKYVDIIEKPTISEQIKRANMEIRIGSHRLAAETFDVRLEIKRGEFVNLLHLGGQAQVTIPSGETRSGLLIDVDTIVDHRTADFELFARELPDRLERIHTENKTRVFECLTAEAIEELEPIYDGE